MFRNEYINYVKYVSCNIMCDNGKLQIRMSIKMKLVHELWSICVIDVMKLFKKNMR